ncbi:MAG TPA: AI-2E family transporter [Chthoniobacteraceae bacterium]|nr:AI-2E family transporter [Chthoniobacteraceae bacterium]
MDLQDYPTASQRKTIWAALTALSTVAIGAIGVGLIWLISRVLGFLQPILIPFAIAGVIAYLLDPIVSKIVSWGTSRQRAVLGVFTVFSLALAGVLVWIIPAVWVQMAHVVQKVPGYRARIIENVNHFNVWARGLERKYGVRVMPQIPEKIEIPQIPPEVKSTRQGEDPGVLKEVPEGTPPTPEKPALPVVESAVAPSPATTEAPTATRSPTTGPDTIFDLNKFLSADWARTTLWGILKSTWSFVRNSIGGFLGLFGFLLSMIIVPIYLYYFLIESKNISEYWGDYLPLRASALKDEVVSVLGEINGYLIAFFRGQLLVSVINGTATGLGLVFVGLDFGILIGVTLCFMGLIPYLGITLCWIPAVIIASVQDGSWLVPAGAAWWVFPLVVTGIFVAVQQVDGLFITPKIVGESVGLHPMTVIVSVFVWTLLMGGLLGAILAVPMTATVKVLLRRYVWERRFRADNAAVTEEQFSELQARSGTPEVSSVRGE